MKLDKSAYIFDFDDTLIHTTANVLIKDKNTGNIIRRLTTAEFNNSTDTLNDNEEYDFSEFTSETILQNEQPTDILKILKAMLSAGYDCFIVTNRQQQMPIYLYLISEGVITMPKNRIICTNEPGSKYAAQETSDEMRKLDVLIDLYNEGYRQFNVWEDSEKMRDAMLMILEHAYDTDIMFHPLEQDNTESNVDDNDTDTWVRGTLKGSRCSFHGIEIAATLEDLIEALGESDGPSGDDKSTNNWHYINESGDYMCVLYDWKYYDGFDPWETINWNIGGPDTISCIRFKNFLEDKLNKTN